MPQRAHQIMGVLEGIKSFHYLHGFLQEQYRLVSPGDLFNPNPRCLFHNIPVLHINSFLEHNHHMKEFLPQYEIDYNIKIITNDQSKQFTEVFLNKYFFNIFLYCSNYKNNFNCKMHPYPQFWADLAEIVYRWQSDIRPLCVNVVGADYDFDLTNDVYKLLLDKKIETKILINFDFTNIIEVLRQSDFVICYESGMGVLADCMKVPCVEIFRCQGGTRDDHLFHQLGPFNLDNINKTFFPMFYDDTLKDIEKKLKND